MTLQTRGLVLSCAMAALTTGQAVLLAADPPARIYRGLFGPDPDVALTSHPIVELRVATYEARGETPARAGEGLDETHLQSGEFYSGLTAGLSYRRKTRTAIFNAGLGHAFRVYQLTGFTPTEQSGYAGAEVRASRRTVVRAAGSVLRTPFHQ